MHENGEGKQHCAGIERSSQRTSLKPCAVELSTLFSSIDGLYFNDKASQPSLGFYWPGWLRHSIYFYKYIGEGSSTLWYLLVMHSVLLRCNNLIANVSSGRPLRSNSRRTLSLDYSDYLKLGEGKFLPSRLITGIYITLVAISSVRYCKYEGSEFE